jgi:hypothetical protein
MVVQGELMMEARPGIMPDPVRISCPEGTDLLSLDARTWCSKHAHMFCQQQSDVLHPGSFLLSQSPN